MVDRGKWILRVRRSRRIRRETDHFVHCEIVCVVHGGSWRREVEAWASGSSDRLRAGRGEREGSCRACMAWLLGSGSQAREGMWGMPGHTEARKAVVSCDKPGGAAHRQWALDGRMGQPGGPATGRHSFSNESEPGELKHLSTRRKRHQPRSPK